MFELQQLRYQYPGGQPLGFPDWQLAAGASAVLIGPSGSGKTTLLSLLGGLLQPSSGRALLAGEDIHALPAAQRDAWRGRKIGFIPQRAHLIASLNVAENLQLAQYLARLPQNNAQISAALEQLGLSTLARRKPAQLSQGQAQRVAIARAVVNQPCLLLADEPTASLDDANAAAVLDLLQTAAASAGASLLLASHDQRVKSRLSQHFVLEGAV